jgi:REP element-mobilizing transposase RayT
MYSDPLAYFITWTCYGTWLPGDERGWNKWQKGEKIPQPLLADWCKERLAEKPIVLSEDQRAVVENTIAKHCKLRGWKLHAVNCRSNHCHVVVSANSHAGEQVRDQFKAWCTRKLKEAEERNRMEAVGRKPSGIEPRENWWTRKGGVRYVFDEESLEAAIRYTREAQEVGGSKFDG